MSFHEEIRRWSGVERRSGDADANWPATIEDEKAALARTLHDRTGTMLVAARMDISWSEKNYDAGSVRSRLLRARNAIDDVIDLNRRIIEELHPTLLDTFGLPAALRWHLARISDESGIPCSAANLDSLPEFYSRPAIALYRIAQLLLRLLIVGGSSAVSLTLSATDACVVLSLAGTGIAGAMTLEDQASRDAIALVRSRLRAFRGELSYNLMDDHFLISCRIPADIALRLAAADAPE